MTDTVFFPISKVSEGMVSRFPGVCRTAPATPGLLIMKYSKIKTLMTIMKIMKMECNRVEYIAKDWNKLELAKIGWNVLFHDVIGCSSLG